MAWLDDIDVLNNAATMADFETLVSGFDSPTLNDSAATTPIYVEGSACAWWPLKKGTTNGYVATATISGTPTLTGRIVVGFVNYPFADINNIPITAFHMRLSSDTGFTTNYLQWDAAAQVTSPENVPISGHTPVIGYEDAGTETGTFSGNCESIGWVATTGSNADGKQGGFDWFFVIGYIGAHSATYNGTYLSGLASEYYDNEGSGLPGQTSRPIAVFSRAGDYYQGNIRLRVGHGASDTANIDITESAKVIFFNNLHINHELGYVVVNPSSSHEARLTLTSVTHFWNDQAGTSEIIDGLANLDYCEITNCAFSRGGRIPMPSDSVNRWVRGSTFSDCQAGTGTDGEFSNCAVDSCEALTISGDADLTGTSILTPVVAADAAGLVWNGAFDPDGNLDGMTFSKGTNAHHAIELGVATPLSITLRDIDFIDFVNTIGSSAAPLHVKRTSGTVTVNLINCTGISADGYKSAGATVVIQATVSLTISVQDEAKAAIQNAQTSIHLLNSPFTELMNEDTTALGVASESYNYPGTPTDIVVKVRKSETTDNPRYYAKSSTGQINASGFSLTVTLEANTFL